MKQFSFLITFLFFSLGGFSLQGQIIEATVIIIDNCTDGKINGFDGSCLYKVHFYNENSLTLAQAQTKASQNGWTIATGDEVSAAWGNLGLNQFAYGMLSDGRFAVPIQSDVNQFKKGANVGITGGNQGFFYTIKPVAPIVPPPPPPLPPGAVVISEYSGIGLPGGPSDIGTYADMPPPNNYDVPPRILDDYYKREFFRLNGIPYDDSEVAVYHEYESKYGSGIGNIMQDKWADPDYGPILNTALNNYIEEKFKYKYDAFPDAQYMNEPLFQYLKLLLQSKDENCVDCRIAKYEFIGFFVPEYLKMLRTGSNQTLKNQFAQYVSYHVARGSRKTLEAWKYYSRRSSAQLNDEPYIPGLHLNDAPALVDPSQNPDEQGYSYNTMSSIFIDTAVPMPGKSVDDFKSCCMQGSPMYFSDEQMEAMSDYVMPIIAYDYPEGNDYPDIVNVPNYLGKNIAFEAKALNWLAGAGTKAGISAGIGGTVLFGAFAAQALAHATSVAAIMSATPINGVLFHVGINAAKLGAQGFTAALNAAILPVAVGVGVFMVGFMPTGGKAIEIAIFEDKLKSDSYITQRNMNWMTMSDGDKVENFAFLFKMLVMDATDYTYYVPEKVADKNQQRLIETAAIELASYINPVFSFMKNDALATMDERYSAVDIYFNEKNDLTLAQAQNIAAQNDWKLATANEVQEAWNNGYQAVAYSRIADGRFAMPIQADVYGFKKGTNIGTTGGNNGFFYTVEKKDYQRIQNNWYKNYYVQSQESNAIQGVQQSSGVDQWKKIPTGDGWFRIQNLKNPNHYLHNQNGRLEVGPIQPNWYSAQWKFEPTGNDWGRIQNRWYTTHYFHNQNGALELGPIQPNWASAIWKFN